MDSKIIENKDLEYYLKDIRHNCLEAEKCISEQEYYESLEYMKNAMVSESNSLFMGKISIKECENDEEYTPLGKCYHLAYANKKLLKIVFDIRKYESFCFNSNKIYLPDNCVAPSLFEGMHHSLQFSLLDMKLPELKEFHSKNMKSIEECAYYWRVNIFPEDKKRKDSFSDYSYILKKSPEEIIIQENKMFLNNN